MRIQEYKRQKLKRLTTFLILGIWLVGSIIRCEIEVTFLNICLLFFWFCALIWILSCEAKRRSVYKHDLIIVEEFRVQNGEDRAFEEKIQTDSDKHESSSEREHDYGKAFLYFSITMGAAFTLRYFINHVWPLLK